MAGRAPTRAVAASTGMLIWISAAVNASHAQLLEKPDDAMRARVLEVVDGDHNSVMLPV